MPRLLPIILISAGLGLHYMYCEWDFPADLRQVSQKQHERTIFFRASYTQRLSKSNVRTYRKNIYLLARPWSNREEAQFYGVLVPLVLIGGTLFWLRRPPSPY